jgi:hypothetical protein
MSVKAYAGLARQGQNTGRRQRMRCDGVCEGKSGVGQDVMVANMTTPVGLSARATSAKASSGRGFPPTLAASTLSTASLR